MARDQETKTQKKRAERGKEIGIDKSGGKTLYETKIEKELQLETIEKEEGNKRVRH